MTDNTHWGALARRPLRMYSGGTLASSGATAVIKSREASAKWGRLRVRGSCTLGADIGIAWWWPWPCMGKEWGCDATWNILISWSAMTGTREDVNCASKRHGYILTHNRRTLRFHITFLGHSFVAVNHVSLIPTLFFHILVHGCIMVIITRSVHWFVSITTEAGFVFVVKFSYLVFLQICRSTVFVRREDMFEGLPDRLLLLSEAER